MEIIFLGTSQAIPTAKRSHTAILLRHEDEMILIDCGEGTQRQFRIARLNPCKLTKILITHWHGDHILGLPGLLQTLALNNYSKVLHLYGPPGTRRLMQLVLNMFIFTGKVKVEIHEIEKDGKFYENSFALEAYKLKHSAACLGYVFAEKNKRKIDIAKARKLGLRQGPLLGKLQKGKQSALKAGQ